MEARQWRHTSSRSVTSARARGWAREPATSEIWRLLWGSCLRGLSMCSELRLKIRSELENSFQPNLLLQSCHTVGKNYKNSCEHYQDGFFMILEPPGPPRKLAVEDITDRSCRVTWKAPDFDGGSLITGYFVEKKQGYSDRWIKVWEILCTSKDSKRMRWIMYVAVFL